MNSSLNNILTRAVLQRFRQDQGKQFLQVTGKAGETRSDVEQLCQYGFRSRPLAGARGVMLAYGGNKQNATVINVDDKRYGQDTLQEGDVMLYNEMTGTRIILRDDDIIATAANQASVTVGSTTFTIGTASIVLVAGGKTFTFDSTGLTTDGKVISNGIELDTHLHGGVTTGGSNTGAPV